MDYRRARHDLSDIGHEQYGLRTGDTYRSPSSYRQIEAPTTRSRERYFSKPSPSRVPSLDRYSDRGRNRSSDRSPAKSIAANSYIESLTSNDKLRERTPLFPSKTGDTPDRKTLKASSSSDYDSFSKRPTRKRYAPQQKDNVGPTSPISPPRKSGDSKNTFQRATKQSTFPAGSESASENIKHLQPSLSRTYSVESPVKKPTLSHKMKSENPAVSETDLRKSDSTLVDASDNLNASEPLKGWRRKVYGNESSDSIDDALTTEKSRTTAEIRREARQEGVKKYGRRHDVIAIPKMLPPELDKRKRPTGIQYPPGYHHMTGERLPEESSSTSKLKSFENETEKVLSSVRSDSDVKSPRAAKKLQREHKLKVHIPGDAGKAKAEQNRSMQPLPNKDFRKSLLNRADVDIDEKEYEKLLKERQMSKRYQQHVSDSPHNKRVLANAYSQDDHQKSFSSASTDSGSDYVEVRTAMSSKSPSTAENTANDKKVPTSKNTRHSKQVKNFIGDVKNIDLLLGDSEDFDENQYDFNELEKRYGDKSIIAKKALITTDGLDFEQTNTANPYIHNEKKLEDIALQVSRPGEEYGQYLDLESSFDEQDDDLEDFEENQKNILILRTQLSVKVHACIERLLNSTGKDLRRALFSLKQLFQEDKDLVHEFVQNDGLACLIKVGSESDQNYQNYVLRALGQVMLYVDGMNGVIDHNETVQWLYSLLSSKYRLVVKTALKLLLVFLEYAEANAELLIQAINIVDLERGTRPWSSIMQILDDKDTLDTELLIYALTLINKCLASIPDQDTFYDICDNLEEQGMERISIHHMSRNGTDIDLIEQFQQYDMALKAEDVVDSLSAQPNNCIRKVPRSRKDGQLSATNTAERRKSKRHSAGYRDISPSPSRHNFLDVNTKRRSSASDSSEASEIYFTNINDSNKSSVNKEKKLNSKLPAVEDKNLFRKEDSHLMDFQTPVTPRQKDFSLRMMYGGNKGFSNEESETTSKAADQWNVNSSKTESQIPSEKRRDGVIKNYLESIDEKAAGGVKDLATKLKVGVATPSTPDAKTPGRLGDSTGLIAKAKESLATSVLSPGREKPKTPEKKKSEADLQWEMLMNRLNRPLRIGDMDFTDLVELDDYDCFKTASTFGAQPPPPPCAPPLNDLAFAPSVPPAPPDIPLPPKAPASLANKIQKRKRTIRLFWKEIRTESLPPSGEKSDDMIWTDMSPIQLDTEKLEHLFENRSKDVLSKKQEQNAKTKVLTVLESKRSNVINIGMTKLPPPRAIKTAILKMDHSIINKEGLEKILQTMLPTSDEKQKILEAQVKNPDVPLGSAEQFILVLSSITELEARLRLWLFKLDYDNAEKDVAEPLMDLKFGMEELRKNRTFKLVLSTLLGIGNFLNGSQNRGFQYDYLVKVPEVKDTVHKQTLLHHVCSLVMERYPDTTDIYSDFGPIVRCSKVDFDELSTNLEKMEHDCKDSWEHLRVIAKHEVANSQMKQKMLDFLTECAERIMVLKIVHRRVVNRYHRLLLWLGLPMAPAKEQKINSFCKVISEFALEYRTTKERVQLQQQKKKAYKERKLTRGKLITETEKFKVMSNGSEKTETVTDNSKLNELLNQGYGSDLDSGCAKTISRRSHSPRREETPVPDVNGDDEILESLVKSATTQPNTRAAPRERKRARQGTRKSLRRTLKTGLDAEEERFINMLSS